MATIHPKSLKLIFMAVGSEVLPLLENSLISVEKNIGYIDKVIYTTVNQPAALSDLASRYNASIVEIRDVQAVKSNEFISFGTDEFNLVTSKKWWCIQDALRSHDLVIFSDCDVVWLRNFKTYLNQWSVLYSIGVQSESTPSHPVNYCTGIMYWTKNSDTERVLELLSIVNDQHASSGNDQNIFNAFVRQNPSLLRIIFNLPEALFMNGMHYKNFLNSHSDLVQGSLEPFAFHANFVAGLTNKIKLLKLTSNWYLQPL